MRVSLDFESVQNMGHIDTLSIEHFWWSISKTSLKQHFGTQHDQANWQRPATICWWIQIETKSVQGH